MSFGDSVGYGFGFNGMIRDDEVKGSGNSYDFGARMQDSRIGGRFWSIDPKWHNFLNITPYAFAANNPIFFIDENGESPGYSVMKFFAKNGRTVIAVSNSGMIGAGLTASIGSGMAVDKHGNVALFQTKGGLSSSETRERGPSIYMGGSSQVSAELAILPGLDNVKEILGHGGELGSGYGNMLISLNVGLVVNQHDEYIGAILGSGLGPSIGGSYQNTFVNGVLMTEEEYEQFSEVVDDSWSRIFKKTKNWNRLQGEGVWEVGKSIVDYQEVEGKKGVMEAVVTTTLYFKTFGEANEVITTTTDRTGVYFKKDNDGNFISNGLQK